MKSFVFKSGIVAAAAALFFTSCSDDNEGPIIDNGSDKYVLITMSDQSLEKPGFASVFDQFPSGDIVNNGPNSLQGLGFGGWRPYGNQLLKMFNTSANAYGIEELTVTANSTVSPGRFIAANNSVNGSGNFVIENDTKGYYWDGASPLKIQIFNPTTMARTGEIDLTEAVNERGQNEAGITFRSVGQKFLAIKNGKLYANVTYATTAIGRPQQGFFDDFYPDVYLAVINTNTNGYEKTIKIEDTGSIAYVNDNHMYDFDINGDLYIVTQGRSATGGKSKIVRIKANESEIDQSWELNMDEIHPGGKRKFVSVFAKNGKIITVIPNADLTGGPDGNINFSDVWEFYSIDIPTQEMTKIEGIPVVTNPGAAFAVIELDGKILLRGTTEDGSINGYFELNGTTATQLFNVTAGGSVSGLHKVSMNN